MQFVGVKILNILPLVTSEAIHWLFPLNSVKTLCYQNIILFRKTSAIYAVPFCHASDAEMTHFPFNCRGPLLKTVCSRIASFLGNPFLF